MKFAPGKLAFKEDHTVLRQGEFVTGADPRQRADDPSAITMSESKTMKPEEAAVIVMIMAITADGALKKIEVDLVNHIIRTYPFFRNLQRPIMEVVDEGARYMQHGLSDLIPVVKNSLSEEERVTAFAFAVDLVMADRRLDDKETQMLKLLADRLDMAPPHVSAVLDSSRFRHMPL